MNKIILLIALVLLLSNYVYADSITIDSVDVNPARIEPGNSTKIIIRLQNQGDKDIDDIKVSLDLSSNELPFAPIDSAAQKIIDEIQEGDFEEVIFTIKVASEARSQIYKIPLVISYKEDEQLVTETSIIGVEVSSIPVIEVAIEESEVYKLNQAGDVTIRFVNKGLGDIKFLSVKLPKNAFYDILSTDSFYVGNIEPDDFETVDFKMNFKGKVNSLKVLVEYRDSNNKLYKKTYSLPITLYTQEEAYTLGLEKKSNPFLLIGIVAIIIIIILVLRLRRRKKNIVK